MSELHVMDETGDTKLIWDKSNRDEVKNAEETFDRLKKKGFIAYSVDKEGGKGKVISAFDADAQKIIMSPAMAGG
jgi:hypothetical protein